MPRVRQIRPAALAAGGCAAPPDLFNPISGNFWKPDRLNPVRGQAANLTPP